MLLPVPAVHVGDNTLASVALLAVMKSMLAGGTEYVGLLARHSREPNVVQFQQCRSRRPLRETRAHHPPR